MSIWVQMRVSATILSAAVSHSHLLFRLYMGRVYVCESHINEFHPIITLMTHRQSFLLVSGGRLLIPIFVVCYSFKVVLNVIHTHYRCLRIWPKLVCISVLYSRSLDSYTHSYLSHSDGDGIYSQRVCNCTAPYSCSSIEMLCCL